MQLVRGGLVVRKAPDGGRAMLAELTDAAAKKVLAVHMAMRRVELARMRRLLGDCLAGLGVR